MTAPLRNMTQSEQSQASVEEWDAPAPLPLREAIVDGEGRTIHLTEYSDAVFEPLVAMYRRFDSSDCASGLPPVEASEIPEWLDAVVTHTSVLAWHDDAVVGQVLFADGADGRRHEVAVFVKQRYRDSGIGKALVETGLSRLDGTEVWLIVHPANRRAIHLFSKLGFTIDNESPFEVEMSREIAQG